MAITNPDSLLDKNGLAYYHSKLMQEMGNLFGVNINVTQSANQTIAWTSPEIVLRPEDGTEQRDDDPPFGYIESGACNAVAYVRVEVKGDSSYIGGDIIADGYATREDADYSSEDFDKRAYFYVPLGGTLTISAEPPQINYGIVIEVESMNGGTPRLWIINEGSVNYSNVVLSCSQFASNFTKESLPAYSSWYDLGSVPNATSPLEITFTANTDNQNMPTVTVTYTVNISTVAGS